MQLDKLEASQCSNAYLHMLRRTLTKALFSDGYMEKTVHFSELYWMRPGGEGSD